jgi:hypothetical protein
LAFDTPIIADLMLVPHMEFISVTPREQGPVSAVSGSADWLARMQAMPNMRATAWEKLQQAA